MSGAEVLGLIAGRGSFPLAVARSAKRRDQKIVCVALRDLADASIEAEVADVTWIHLGDIGAGIAALKRGGVSEAVMAGKVPKSVLFGDRGALHLDANAEQLMNRLRDNRDDTILAAIADFLGKAGIRLLPQWALSPELLAGSGPLGKLSPTPEQWADIAFGFPIAKTIGNLDVGQTVVVKDLLVLAIEAIEGTDAAIRRAGEISPRGCVVKVAKPGQDPRFDVPTIGPHTLESLEAASAVTLAFESGATVVLEREKVARRADALGISVVGVDAETLLSDAP